MKPAIGTLSKRKTPFTGFLYAGIMVDESTGKPLVLEFNARMGDPECQPIMMRMKSDLYPYLDAASKGELDSLSPIAWRDQAAVCVVMAAKGYPGSYEKGKIIEGLDSDPEPDVMVFQAGTTRNAQGKVVTNGGRVLGVTALGENAQEAADRAYSAVRRLSWGNSDQQYRTDIAKRAIARQRK
jgi:phosphoribosylamine--glycine ligase